MGNQAPWSPIDEEPMSFFNALCFNLKTFEGGDRQLVKCPTCGKEVETPIKEWDMGKNKKIHVKQYDCCGKKFREYGKRV